MALRNPTDQPRAKGQPGPWRSRLHLSDGDRWVLRRRREALGLSQRQVALACNVSRIVISQMERHGLIAPAALERIEAYLAEALVERAA